MTRAPDGTSENSDELRPILVLALDGATFDVIRPLAEEGRLPNLAAWMSEGRAGGLASTTPPVTFPAWSSFMTGLAPADHGIFDFTQKKSGEYRLRFINSTDREAPSIFRRVCDAGGTVLVLGMPATHPPEPLDGSTSASGSIPAPITSIAEVPERMATSMSRECSIRYCWSAKEPIEWPKTTSGTPG